jgi:hypothetical protein
MNAHPDNTIVIQTPTVLILKEHLTVLVKMAIMEMVSLVKVGIKYLLPLALYGSIGKS